jgi:hypothetical protein
MKIDLADVLRDGPLTTLALAIALGWSLFQTGRGQPSRPRVELPTARLVTDSDAEAESASSLVA